MRQGLFPISIVCAVTATSSRKNFDKPSIATEKSFCNSKDVHSRSKQCRRSFDAGVNGSSVERHAAPTADTDDTDELPDDIRAIYDSAHKK